MSEQITGVNRESGIKEVAQIAGVSVGTVSNVLNRPHLVADATRQRVQAALDELGYVRNGSARNLRSGRSDFIGLAVLDVTNPFFTEAARGAEDAASASGHAVVLCNSDDSSEKEARYLRMLEEQRARGLIITPVASDYSHLAWARERGMAVVLLDRPSGYSDQCSVAVDDVTGGRLAGQHLLAMGHERIYFVRGPLSIQQCVDRRQGIRDAVETAGLDPDDAITEIEVPTLVSESGERAAVQLLSGASSRRPTAAFCINDVVALGMLRGLTRAGLRIPQDMALVGYDDVDFASLLRTPLTTIRQPKYELGQAAMRLLLDEVYTENHTHRQLLFRPELMIRESTATHS